MQQFRNVAQNTPVNLSQIIDHGDFTPYQLLVVIVVACAVIIDGFDSQLTGYAIPALMQEWGVARNAFVPVVAAGFAGMVIGGIASGLLADRLGRRKLLLANLFIFGVATFIVGLVDSIAVIACCRFIAGLGIGGAMPVCATIVAEFTPSRYRAFSVTGTMVCTPLGGMIAGYSSGHLISCFGWQSLFFIGGVMPVALMAVVWFVVPETPFYLSRDRQRWPELRQLLGRMQKAVAHNAFFLEEETKKKESRGNSFALLFKAGLKHDTIALCFVFLFSGFTVYSAFGWLPTMLTAENITIETAGYGLANYNLGGLIGALACGYMISRTGSFWPMLISATGAWLSLLVLAFIDMSSNISLLIALLMLHGFFINGIQAPMYALCAYVYPTDMRATGTSAASSFGRIGAIIAGFTGAPVITQAGGRGFLAMLIATVIIITFGLLCIRKHIPFPDRKGGKRPG